VASIFPRGIPDINRPDRLPFSGKRDAMRVKNSPLSEIALVLVCFDHVASVIVNANHSVNVNGCEISRYIKNRIAGSNHNAAL
jgi:hypothetical protein